MAPNARTILITGSTSGIGKGVLESSRGCMLKGTANTETAIRIAREQHTVVIASRTKTKVEETVNSIKKETNNPSVFGIVLDLSSLHCVKESVEVMTKSVWWTGLDVVVLNAAWIGAPSSTLVLTEDGIEMTYACNQMGHFYLTKLLLPQLLEKAEKSGVPSRIIALGSGAHDPSTKIGAYEPLFDPLDWISPNTYHFSEAYANSKLSNVLFGLHLSKLHPEKVLRVSVFDPGFISETGLFKDMMPGYLLPVFSVAMKIRMAALGYWYGSVKQVSDLATSCGFLKELAVGDVNEGVQGGYYVIDKLWEASEQARDLENQKGLWDVLERVLVEKGFS
ncbi:Retinol dehydrogenase 13 [Phlyctochytrium planicorne]|nr:Retinol dehydrogenase 13 [Phlyctochytrium planicorne]